MTTGGWNWNEALLAMPGRWTEVADELFSFALQLRRERCTSVYDLGCGVGRHTAFLAAAGFDVTASDISESAIRHTRTRLENDGLDARVLHLNMLDWPFAAGSFDAVVAFNVVYHATREQVDAVLDRILASLAPGGLLFITFKSTLDSEFGQGRELAPFTFVPVTGIETGIPHFFTDAQELRGLLRGFRILSMVHKTEYPVAAGDDRLRAHWVVRARSVRTPPR